MHGLDAEHKIEILHLSVEPHLYGDYSFGWIPTLLAYVNRNGALRELTITFDIQGKAEEASHQRLLTALSDSTDVTALGKVLATERYAALETVELALRVGFLESRSVKSREAIWMERVEGQLHDVCLKGILS